MSNQTDTAVIIVNWNGQHLLKSCLSSLRNQTYKNFKVVLVDNGSSDDSVGYVKDKFTEVGIIKLKHNTGFAKGNNIGISKALADKKIQKVVLLNNDTKVKNNFLEELIQELKVNKNKKIGAIAPKMLLWDKDAESNRYIIDAIGARTGEDGRGYNIGSGEIDNGQYDKAQELFGFCGGAVLLTRNALEDVVDKNKWTSYQLFNKQIAEPKTKIALQYQQYFDDNFFAYYEDTDLSWRLSLRGWKMKTAPMAVVYHIHSATPAPFSFFKEYYLNRNRFLMMFKNFPCKFLWKGIFLIPGSYLKIARIRKRKGDARSNTQGISSEKKIIRKIKMIGVMTKIFFNICLNIPQIIYQRRRIQYNKVIDNGEVERWFKL